MIIRYEKRESPFYDLDEYNFLVLNKSENNFTITDFLREVAQSVLNSGRYNTLDYGAVIDLISKWNYFTMDPDHLWIMNSLIIYTEHDENTIISLAPYFLKGIPEGDLLGITENFVWCDFEDFVNTMKNTFYNSNNRAISVP